jgi:hypothetical protein
MRNIHFITFANTTSTFNLKRILDEAKNANCFATITGYTEKDFDSDYVKLCGDRFERFPRGYGYWSWKSYVIKKRLSEIDEGDFLIYADCGCTIKKENMDTLDFWLSNINETGMFSPGYMPDNIEVKWNKGDLVDFINKKYNKNYNLLANDNTGQINASVIIIKKNTTSVNIIDDWYDVCNNHFELINDSPSKLPNNRIFREHRHDQAALSLIYKIYTVPYIPYKTGKGNHTNLAFIKETKIKK